MFRRRRAGREGTPMLKVVHDEAEPNEASGSVLDEIVRELRGRCSRSGAGAAGQRQAHRSGQWGAERVRLISPARARKSSRVAEVPLHLRGPAGAGQSVPALGMRVSAGADKGHDRRLTRRA